MIVYVSYIPRRRSFTAHREGLGEITGSDLQELRAKLAAVNGEQKFRLSLSRAARAELLRRKNGAPAEIGWT